MTKQEIINYMYENHVQGDFKIEEMAEDLAQPETHDKRTETYACDFINRQALMKEFADFVRKSNNSDFAQTPTWNDAVSLVGSMPPAQPEPEKYEYHYDHTDCIWYRPEARNRCPVTCAQYRDGWNDAMNYIFRDGKGYMPYRREKQYGE